MLLDVTKFNLTGKDAEEILGSIHIAVNKNTIPGETQSPFITSGIRIGTPAITTRGFKEKEAERVAEMIVTALSNPTAGSVLTALAAEALDLTAKFPIYAK